VFLYKRNNAAMPATWQMVTVDLHVPAGTTYLAARIVAHENIVNDFAGNEQSVTVPGGMVPQTYYRIGAGW